MKIGILTGTRPDIIKMAPLFWECEKRGHRPVLVHVAQHYPFHLYEGVYRDLELPFPPHFEVGMTAVKKLGQHASKIAHHADLEFGWNLTKKLETVAEQVVSRRPNPAGIVANAMLGLTKLFKGPLKDVDIMLTHGDTLTCMAGSLSASLNLIPVGHVEAGLRTFSKEPFPEQIDTRTSDACSDLYFAATKTNEKNLLNEGFAKERVFTVGNTVVDAAKWASKKGEKSREFFEKKGIDFSKKIIYASCHRRENLMHKQRFEAITNALFKLSNEGFQILWSIRPGTATAIKEYGMQAELEKHPNIMAVPDIPNYTDTMFLLSKARMIITDSGSMQEEAAALHVPCVTARFVTDRPESVEAGVNVLAPPKSANDVMRAAYAVEEDNDEMRKKKNPYGDGNSSKLIVDAIEKFEGKLIQWEHQK